MLHIITVHWGTAKWIEIQHEYFKQHIKVPYKVIGFLDGIDGSYDRYFDTVNRDGIQQHQKKLDLAARQLCESADPEDHILFIDGDAFPINNISPLLDKLESYPIVAVQRTENKGDIQPHPSFCLTTVKFWKRYEPSWARGYKWKDSTGRWVTDVGGELLRILEENHIEWYKMNRTNKINPAPLLFGVYDNMVYHHAFGFRDGFGGRISLANEKLELHHFHFITIRLTRMKNPKMIAIRNRIFPFYRKRTELFERTRQQNDAVYEQIKADKQFYKSLVE